MGTFFEQSQREFRDTHEHPVLTESEQQQVWRTWLRSVWISVPFQVYACMMVFFLSNMIENQCMSTGAFEITLNGEPRLCLRGFTCPHVRAVGWRE